MADPDLTLLYDFARNKSLAASQGLGPTLTCVRAGVATVVNGAGFIENVAANIPRFDFDPATGRSLGLLVEESRENICLQSEDLGTTWSEFQARDNADTLNVAVAPDGTTTADRIIDDSGGGTGSVLVAQTITTAVDTAYTFSCFLKAEQLDWAYLEVNSMAAQALSAYFDLTDGAVGATVGGDVTSTFIEDIGNGWFRCGLTFTSDGADTSAGYQIWPADDNNDKTVARDGTSSILAWGAQLEAGAFPTSYIPTTTTSELRDRDFVNTTDVGWYDQNVGTMYFAFTAGQDVGTSSVDQGAIFGLYEANNSYITAGQGTGGINADDIAFYWLDTGADQAYINTTNVVVTNTLQRGAMAWAENDFATSFIGAAVKTDSSGTIPGPITELRIGADPSGVNLELNGHIAEIRYYNVRMDNQFLEDLSNGLISEDGLGFTRDLSRPLARNLARSITGA